jgi:hypothetical protein
MAVGVWALQLGALQWGTLQWGGVAGERGESLPDAVYTTVPALTAGLKALLDDDHFSVLRALRGVDDAGLGDAADPQPSAQHLGGVMLSAFCEAQLVSESVTQRGRFKG